MKHFELIILIALGAFFPGSIGVEVSAEHPIIDGIRCERTELLDFHYHAHLSIFVNGSSYLIPAGVGIKLPDCIYWLHTHDTSGLIHIESPKKYLQSRRIF